MTPPDEHLASEERRGSALYERIAKLEAQTALGERLVKMELQIGRLVSDYESEKGTRARSVMAIDTTLKDMDLRMRRMERNFYLAAGAVVAADYLFRMFVR